jgi:predicted Zn-dependent protease
MGLLSRLLGLDFLGKLTPAERVQISNVPLMLYDLMRMEKSGQKVPNVPFDSSVVQLLRKVSRSDLYVLKASVENGTKAEQVPGPLRIDYLRKAVKLNPYNSVAMMSYGVVLAQEGHLQEGLTWLEKAQALDPSDERIRHNLEAVNAASYRTGH